MGGIRPFQIALMGLFLGLAVLGLIVFLVFDGGTSGDERLYGDQVVIWGTFDQQVFLSVVEEITRDDKDFNAVQYVEVSEDRFDLELLNAIAEGRSPDLVILPHESLVTHRAKLAPISTKELPARDFRNTFIDGAEVFLLSDGTYALPFAVDPLVMYWNRDVFSSSGLASPPTTWETLVSRTTPATTITDSNFDILQSAVALGEYRNVNHTKEILTMLFMQAGSTIVEESSGVYNVTLLQEETNTLNPADAALSFYTQFATPSNQSYTWNRSLPNNRLMFVSGDLGIYFGFGSERDEIESTNPNLNFDMTVVPQGANATIRRGFGAFYGFAIPRASTNKLGAYQVAQVLASENVAVALALRLGLAPVHRTELTRGSNDPYDAVRYEAALTARGWLDPNPTESDNVFRQMVEDVTSGRARVSQAIVDMAGRLRLIF